MNAENALESDAPSVRGGTNLAGKVPIEFCRGDVDHGTKEAEIIVEQTYRTQSTSPLALEPRYGLAAWEGDRLTVWKASRNVHGDREKLASLFALPHDQVRVLRYVAVHDSGRIIHPEAPRGQVIGGGVQGIGYALMEEIPMDPDTGAPLTLNLDSFKIPT